MARKSKAAGPKPAGSDASLEKQTTTPNTSARLKRKIDWATIDQNEAFDGFKVKSVTVKRQKKGDKTPAKKQKTGALTSAASDYKSAPLGAEVRERNPFPETDLSEVHCTIVPALEWESTSRYRKFTISRQEFEVGQIVFVKRAEDDHTSPDAIQHWLAKVLEVRAGDAAHVFLRVYWAYRPEDLPGGRQPHHGDSEIIVSNHMDIIEATSVQGPADVMHLDEDVEKSEWPARDQLFWRQSLDVNKPKGMQLSNLKTWCIDKAPCNPDDALVNCPSCGDWLHARCLEEQAVKDACIKYKVPTAGAKKTKSRPKQHARPAFVAELSNSDSGKISLMVTDNRNDLEEQWNVDIRCLLCKKVIEKVTEHAPGSPEAVFAGPYSEDEKDEEDVDGITVATASSKSKAPMPQDDKETSDISIRNPPVHDVPQKRGRGRPPLASTMKRKRKATSSPEANTTPPPAPVDESVFQSGVRSVKRLLWRTT